LNIETSRFGNLQIPDSAIIHFPQGLYGLEGLQRYCLLPHDAAGIFFWLQSADDPHTAMVVTDPFNRYPSYEVEIPDNAANLLRTSAADDLTIYTSVSLSKEPAGAFTNLLGPLVINYQAKVGMQIIQDGNKYSTRHPLSDLDVTAKAA
jgi:flagellar assembly factor FliW